MAKLTKNEVKHIAELSNLDLTDSEIDKFTPQLEEILNHVSQLSKVNTDSVEPTHQTTGLEDVFRKDEISPKEGLTQDQAVSGTDKTYNGYFKVDAILTERTDK